MDDKLVEFANLLRQNGIRVSLAETLDAVAASEVTGLGDSELFRSALRATMIKRASELPVFEELFDVYFSGLGEIIKGASKEVQDALSMSDKDFQKFLDDMDEMLKEHGQELSELAKQLLQNNNGQLERMMRAAARAVRMQAKMEEYLDRRLKMLEDVIRKYVRQEREKRDMKAREEQRMNQLGDKSFYYLSDEELEKMREAVTRLAQRLKNIIAVRRKRMKKGRFDIKRTLRANLSNGGVPFNLKFERRKREKPQILIMCDVSDSVRHASRFMLQFVYSLQDLYSRVRSFVFVADVGEVTESFRTNDVKEALDVALKGDIINVYAHSDFGRSFSNFVTDHIGAINKRTTVIILGDARNNYNLPHDWCLREIRQRARRVIWLNPESRNTWGFGDSEMERYAIHCDLVEECRNPNQVYRVIDQLVPR